MKARPALDAFVNWLRRYPKTVLEGPEALRLAFIAGWEARKQSDKTTTKAP